MVVLYDKGKINGALIIAPKVYRNWFSQEIPNHLARHIDHKTVLWTTLHPKQRIKSINNCLK